MSHLSGNSETQVHLSRAVWALSMPQPCEPELRGLLGPSGRELLKSCWTLSRTVCVAEWHSKLAEAGPGWGAKLYIHLYLAS